MGEGCGIMSELVCCRRQRPLDDTKLSKTALFCFVLGVAIVKGEGISRSLGLFNVKKCETSLQARLCWESAQCPWSRVQLGKPLPAGPGDSDG